MQQYQQTKYLQKIKRNYVVQLLKSDNLEHKIRMAKSAIQMEKIWNKNNNKQKQKGQEYYKLKEICGNCVSKPFKINERSDICYNNGERSRSKEKCCFETQTSNKDISYFKQTADISIQTEDNIKGSNLKKVKINENHRDYQHACSFAEIELIQSKISFTGNQHQNQHEPENQNQSKQSLQFDTCCSFMNQFPTRCNFGKNNSKKNQQKYERNSQQIQNLKNEVNKLKSEIQLVETQKNKWKKKALKSSSKIKLVQSQMQRFQKSYTNTNPILSHNTNAKVEQSK